MLSYFSKRLYPTLFRPKIASSSLSKYYELQEVDFEIRNTLMKISQLQRNIQDLGDQTDYTLSDSIEENLKMYFIYHSNAIEGSKLSLANTVSFLQDDVIKDEDSMRDHMDALGHAAAIGLVGSALRVGEKVDRTLVCEVNDVLTRHIASIQEAERPATVSGTYKIEDNSAHLADGEVHKYVEPSQVSSEMEELFAHCESSQMHPVVKAAVAHYNFTRIHPFQHGNGRGARILMNLILQHYNLPPAIIQVQNKAQYLECLQTADKGDIMPFVSFVASSLVDTMEMILDTYKSECSTAQKAQQIAMC